jgi:hypothetical protein
LQARLCGTSEEFACCSNRGNMPLLQIFMLQQSRHHAAPTNLYEETTVRFSVHLILFALLPLLLGSPVSVLAELVGSKQQEVRNVWPEDNRFLHKGSSVKRSRVEVPRTSVQMHTPEYDSALLQELIGSASSHPLSGPLTHGKPDNVVPSLDEQGTLALEKLLTE